MLEADYVDVVPRRDFESLVGTLDELQEVHELRLQELRDQIHFLTRGPFDDMEYYGEYDEYEGEGGFRPPKASKKKKKKGKKKDKKKKKKGKSKSKK